ncbi:ISL3 family transposase [Roseospira goensis]|uniref:Transposase n=1 Tax=Roseospira goensis TaxID=391922 RepID=A0A7W6WMT4_9PROT|nr:ISL3 family transposase [Roseospira goensis]MBB4287822.1 transposase [Roseospira goensis]
MHSNEILALGLGIEPPWRLVDQRLDTAASPNVLHLTVAADRGAAFACPTCGRSCKAHDFQEFTWRHLNFFQHHCHITARVPRVHCPEHGVHRATVPWAREGSRFTLLFEQAAMMLVREMPVLAAARLMEITDKRLWRIVTHYVDQAVAALDLSDLKAFGLDETAAKRGHTYVTVFIDLDRPDKPVVFVTPGRGKDTVARFRDHLAEHGGEPGRVVEVVSDMSGAFIASVREVVPEASVTVDWFHVVQTFTKALDAVRRAEAKSTRLPKALRWAVLKNADGPLTDKQADALAELEACGHATGEAWRIKEKLRWVRKAETAQAARWRLTHFLRHARDIIADKDLLKPMQGALATLDKHAERILQRWTSGHSTARLEGLNGLFQAARARERGYRNATTFTAMIYLIGAPIRVFVST